MVARSFFALVAIILVQFYGCCSQEKKDETKLLLQNVIKYLNNFTNEFSDLHQKVSEMNEKIDASADAHSKALEEKVTHLKESMNDQITAFAATHMNARCPEGYTTIGKRCLLFQHKDRNYDAAIKGCQDAGGQLLRLDSLGLWESIARFLRANGLQGDYWIGMDDRGSEGQFRYLDGTPVPDQFPLWHRNQPDNYLGEQNCAVILKQYNLELDDLNCDADASFICELDY